MSLGRHLSSAAARASLDREVWRCSRTCCDMRARQVCLLPAFQSSRDNHRLHCLPRQMSSSCALTAERGVAPEVAWLVLVLLLLLVDANYTFLLGQHLPRWIGQYCRQVGIHAALVAAGIVHLFGRVAGLASCSPPSSGIIVRGRSRTKMEEIETCRSK